MFNPMTIPLDWRWRSVSALTVGALSAVVASAVIVPGLPGAIGAGLAILMFAVAITDARHFIIPDWLVVIAVALGFVSVGVDTQFDSNELLIAALHGALAGLAFAALRAAYEKLRKREGMGLGDVKLAVVAGVWLDWTAIAGAVEVAAVAALAVTALHILRRQPITRATRVPFGLYFAPAIWLAWLVQASLLGV